MGVAKGTLHVLCFLGLLAAGRACRDGFKKEVGYQNVRKFANAPSDRVQQGSASGCVSLE